MQSRLKVFVGLASVPDALPKPQVCPGYDGLLAFSCSFTSILHRARWHARQNLEGFSANYNAKESQLLALDSIYKHFSSLVLRAWCPKVPPISHQCRHLPERIQAWVILVAFGAISWKLFLLGKHWRTRGKIMVLHESALSIICMWASICSTDKNCSTRIKALAIAARFWGRACNILLAPTLIMDARALSALW